MKQRNYEMDKPPGDVDKTVPFSTKKATPVPAPHPAIAQLLGQRVKSTEQRLAELELDVFKLVEAVVDLHRAAEEQAKLTTYIVKALVYLSNKIQGE
jgi:hypothetical protein